MKTFGLALSGGGFRACLYHLGVIRYLRDAGLLSRVSHITSVSGGSVIAAHLALNWDRYNSSDSEFDDVADELMQFLQLDVRNRIVRRFPLASAGNMIRRALRLGARRQYTRAGLLELHYERYLYGDTGLFSLPESPRLYMLATDVSEGSICAFFRGGMLLQRRSVTGRRHFEHFPVGLATIPMAVAASSAFPGFFPPLQLTASEVGAKDGEFGRHAFTDGGIYDNIGLRMFHHLQHTSITTRDGIEEGHLNADDGLEGVFVSNAGATFKVRSDGRAGGLLSTAMRSSDILMDRVNQLELESFHGTKGTLFFPITSLVQPSEDPEAIHVEVQRQASQIRTDMDRFSDLEMSALIQHGYCVTRSVCRNQAPELLDDSRETHVWNPFAESEGIARDALSLTSDESALAAGRQLQGSSSRKIFSTLLSFRDWPTYIWLPALALLILSMPMWLYQSNKMATQRGYVITAISETSPVYREILRLIEGGPVSDIPTAPFEDVAKLDPPDYTGFQVLSDNRIFDLRRWASSGGEGVTSPYSHTRIRMKRTKEAKTDRLRLQSISRDEQLAFQCSTETLKPRYYRCKTDDGNYIWELDLDVSHIPFEEDTEIVVEGQLISEYAEKSADGGRFQFTIAADTGLAQIWMLMPEDREYEHFEISGFPIGQPELLETIEPTSKVELPVGAIATFQIINPRSDYRYECRWKWAD